MFYIKQRIYNHYRRYQTKDINNKLHGRKKSYCNCNTISFNVLALKYIKKNT